MKYIFKPDVQQVLDDLSALFGGRTIFLSPSMEEVRVGEQQRISRYCHLIQNDLGLHSLCINSDRARCTQSARDQGVVCYECPAGLQEAVAPVIVDNQLLGFVMIGQFRIATEPPAEILHNCRRRQISTETLMNAFAAVPTISPERLKRVTRVFGLLVDFISRQRLIDIRSQGVVQPLMLHIAENLDKDLTLEEAAALVHRSPSTVSHQFRKASGRSFKKTLIEARMQKAEHYLNHNPELQVSQIAAYVGYPNVHYFSRLFRKYRGMSATQFRAKAQAENADSAAGDDAAAGGKTGDSSAGAPDSSGR